MYHFLGSFTDIKISKVVTKSKFGAPSRKPRKDKQEIMKGIDTIPLPPISTLNLPQSILNLHTLPNDSFSKRYGEINDPAFHTLLTLTPPSSPGDATNQQTIELANNKLLFHIEDGTINKSSKTQNAGILQNAASLVDEHFRNCGIGDFDIKGNEELPDVLQKYFESQVSLV